jgi:hypothetical protein
MNICVKRISLIIGIVLLLISSSNATDSLLIPVQKLGVIYPPQGNPDSSIGLRILARFEIPDSLSDYRITYAEASVPFNMMQNRDTSFSAEVFSITTAWDEDSVTWEFPWINPGGDIDSSLVFSRFFTMGQLERINFDLTNVVNEWLDSSITNNGFIVMVYYPDYRAFRFNIDPLLPYIRSHLYLLIKLHDTHN